MNKVIYMAAALLMVLFPGISHADGTTGGSNSGQSCPTCPAPGAGKAKEVLPDVQYPFTFTCKHCGMKITIKTPADWDKPCYGCACGANNIDCYQVPKKKK